PHFRPLWSRPAGHRCPYRSGHRWADYVDPGCLHRGVRYDVCAGYAYAVVSAWSIAQQETASAAWSSIPCCLWLIAMHRSLRRRRSETSILAARGARAVVFGRALAVALPPSLYAQPVGLPSMGSASAAELSPGLERTLGEAIMEQGRRDPTYVADPDVNQYLTGMGRRLAEHAPGGVGQPITVFSVRDPQINAFALPGGF